MIRKISNLCYDLLTKTFIISWLPLMIYSVTIAYDRIPNCRLQALDPAFLNFVCSNYNMKEILAPLAFVIWTFTVSFIPAYMGRSNEMHHGIRIMDSFLVEFTFFKLVLMFFTFFSEVILFLCSIMFEWRFTFTFSIFIQIVNMIYAMALVCMETSRSTILSRIRVQAVRHMEEKSDKLLLNETIRSCNFYSDDDRESLISLFRSIMEDIKNNKDSKKLVESDKIHDFMYNCTNLLILSINNKEVANDLFKSLLRDKWNLDASKGVISSFVDNYERTNCPDFFQILEMEIWERKELIKWAFIRNGYCIVHKTEHYRTYFLPFFYKLFQSCGFDDNERKNFYCDALIELEILFLKKSELEDKEFGQEENKTKQAHKKDRQEVNKTEHGDIKDGQEEASNKNIELFLNVLWKIF